MTYNEFVRIKFQLHNQFLKSSNGTKRLYILQCLFVNVPNCIVNMI